MFVVAVLGPAAGAAPQLQAFAEALGVTPYEAKARLVGGGPAIVATLPDPDAAERLCAALEGLGFEADVHDATRLAGPGVWFDVRQMSFGADAMVLTARDGGRVTVRYAAIALLVRGVRSRNTVVTERVKTKRFSLGKAMATGGLSRKKKVTTTRERTEVVREGFLHVYAPGLPVCVLGETALDYAALGKARQPTGAASFGVLVTALRRLAPAAGFNDELLRVATQKRILGPTLDPEDCLDLASVILAAARMPGG